MQGNLRQQRVRLLLHVQGEKVIVNGLVHTTKVVDTELPSSESLCVLETRTRACSERLFFV